MRFYEAHSLLNSTYAELPHFNIKKRGDDELRFWRKNGVADFFSSFIFLGAKDYSDYDYYLSFEDNSEGYLYELYIGDSPVLLRHTINSFPAISFQWSLVDTEEWLKGMLVYLRVSFSAPFYFEYTFDRNGDYSFNHLMPSSYDLSRIIHPIKNNMSIYNELVEHRLNIDDFVPSLMERMNLYSFIDEVQTFYSLESHNKRQPG